ncbi:hypothetical protein BH09ACT6_BH09ACT6_09570 [soil metagenome]
MGRVHRRSSAGVIAIGALLAFAGCTSTTAPSPTASVAPTGSAAPAPTSTVVPVFVPNGSAAQNLAFFDSVNNGVIAATAAANTQADGVAFISALRSGGFPVADMQVTPDITTVGVKADSIQFSVAIKGQCLIGQYGFGQYSSIVAPVLGTGACLVGETRPIDW